MHIKIARFSRAMVAVLFSFVLLVISPVSIAGTKVVPVQGVNYIINASMMDNLNSLVGRKVTLTVDGGNFLAGIVKSVGPHLIHLEKIERKEFFDALIRIDSIQAIEVQFREYQR